MDLFNNKKKIQELEKQNEYLIGIIKELYDELKEAQKIPEKKERYDTVVVNKNSPINGQILQEKVFKDLELETVILIEKILYDSGITLKGFKENRERLSMIPVDIYEDFNWEFDHSADDYYNALGLSDNSVGEAMKKCIQEVLLKVHHNNTQEKGLTISEQIEIMYNASKENTDIIKIAFLQFAKSLDKSIV